ncbi:MAG TPA: penicillin-binding protein activator, partial [Gammaproteobacteria bacterium]|nr:penicillin-binding protein activator [Gammaproteobacteria bacterium]
PLLTDPIAVRDNQNAIVQALSGLSDQVLQQLGATPPDVLSGWMELVLIARTTPDPSQYNERVIDWRHRYRQHPATQDLVAALPKQRLPLAGAPGQTVTPEIAAPLQTSPAIAQDYPQQIALLLPLSGKLANVGMAVRDAFQAAASATSGNAQPVIRVYDVAAISTEAEGTKVLQVYQQAVQEGAAFVVGPLEKEGVKALYTLGALPVPTLALNYNEDVTTPLTNLYQFGLLPEDEARQAAERAWLDGHSRALALVPTGEWGERMLNAFTSHLEQLGGIVVDSQSYPADEVDFAKPVRKLLKYSGGKQHRQDADYIFLAAQPRQGRGIRPQLQFFFASDLPVYATSHIYAGKPNRAADQDLDGIAFADMPWVIAEFTPQQALRQSLAAAHASNFEQLKRLYALGVDAYNVIPYLNSLHSAAEQRYAGETGTLRLDENNRLHRQLLWARFAGGEAQLIDGGTAR